VNLRRSRRRRAWIAADRQSIVAAPSDPRLGFGTQPTLYLRYDLAIERTS
jgi:hypothetical protein